MKEIQIDWCENFIKATFNKYNFENVGIETGCFWNIAERSGLWKRGTYGSAMTKAVEKLTNVETILDTEGKYLYSVFRLKQVNLV